MAAEHSARPAHEASERGQYRLARRPVADRAQQLVLEGLEPPVDEVFLGREVVEDRLDGDVGGTCDLRDRDGLEAAFAEQAACRLGDQLAGLLLLALTEPGAHRSRNVAAQIYA